MSGRRFHVARLADMERRPVWEGVARTPVREHFDIGAFGINAFTADTPGAVVVEEHDELGSGAGRHEELYYVVSGSATFTVDGEEVDAPTGTFVFIRDPAARRSATARDPGTTVLAVGGPRGEPFAVAPWEASSAMWPHYQAGDYDRAIQVLADALARYPGNPNVLYNLACCESLAGRRDEALAHLRAAVASDDRFRGHARGDPDFDLIRDDPAFAELTAG